MRVSILSLLLATLGNVHCQQSTPEENISAYFHRLLEQFREHLQTGNPEIDLPISDPLPDRERSHDWEYRNFFGFLESMGDASSWDGQIWGLSRFEIKNVTAVADQRAASLYFQLDFPHYMHYGNYSTSGFMPFLLGTDLPIHGNGTYLVQATQGFPNGTAYPWGGSSHWMDMSPWLNLNDDGTMWLQNVHGYVPHYVNRSSQVWGLEPGFDIPVTPQIQTILDNYGSYITAEIDQAGRNDMYKGVLDYMTWAIEGVLYQDIVEGKYNK